MGGGGERHGDGERAEVKLAQESCREEEEERGADNEFRQKGARTFTL